MSKALSLRSCFNYVFTGFPYEILGSKGFAINHDWDKEKEGVKIQSLLIPSPTNNSVTLEFLEIVDEVEFMNSFKKQNTGQHGRELLSSGLRLWDHEENEDRFQIIGSVPIYLYSNQKKIDSLSQTHSNNSLGALNFNLIKSIWGVYLGLSQTEKEMWSHLLGGAPDAANQWVLKDGCRILCATPDDGLYDYMEPRKDFSFWGVVLQSASWEETAKQIIFDKVFNWNGTKAGLIKERITNWDIIII